MGLGNIDMEHSKKLLIFWQVCYYPRVAVKMKIFKITPVPKPRMTKSDRWKRRPSTDRYWLYKDLIQSTKGDFVMPKKDYWIVFYIPMPKSWPQKKKDKFLYTPHLKTPDKDNLEKAFLDAMMSQDCKIWDGRATKLWGNIGEIVIYEPGDDTTKIREHISKF